METTITFERKGGQKVTATLGNSMREWITLRWLQEAHADGQPDEDLRNAYCWVAAYVKSFSGMSAKQVLVDYGCTREEFDAAYLAFGAQVEEESFWQCVTAIMDARKRKDQMEKPDSALTEAEIADPNS